MDVCHLLIDSTRLRREASIKEDRRGSQARQPGGQPGMSPPDGPFRWGGTRPVTAFKAGGQPFPTGCPHRNKQLSAKPVALVNWPGAAGGKGPPGARARAAGRPRGGFGPGWAPPP